jgi:hypothetical protein
MTTVQSKLVRELEVLNLKFSEENNVHLGVQIDSFEPFKISLYLKSIADEPKQEEDVPEILYEKWLFKQTETPTFPCAYMAGYEEAAKQVRKESQ